MGWLGEKTRDIAYERGRIVLVTLGVVWGTLSLTVVLAFGKGFDVAMQRAMHAGGAGLLRVFGDATTMPYRGLVAGRRIRFTRDDATFVRRAMDNVRAVSVEYVSSGAPVACAGQRVNARVHGVDPAYAELRHFVPQPGGRFLNGRDLAERRRVVFAGSAIKERIFGARPAVGAVVTIWNVPFIVVGVAKPKQTLGNNEGPDPDKLLIPATTYEQVVGARFPVYMLVGLEDATASVSSGARLRALLGPRLGFADRDHGALRVYDKAARDRITTGIVDGVRVLTGIIALLGLAVAFVAVANVMFVMVEERRREIAIQVALGARPKRIGCDRLAEGAFVTVAGGVVGIALSALAVWGMNVIPLDANARGYLGWPELSVTTSLLVASVLGVAGCLAGWWPARRAAIVQPIEVLRDD